MATSIEFIHAFDVNDRWDRRQDSLAKVSVSQVPLILRNRIRCRAAGAGQRTMLTAVSKLQGCHVLDSTKPWLVMPHFPECPHWRSVVPGSHSTARQVFLLLEKA